MNRSVLLRSTGIALTLCAALAIATTSAALEIYQSGFENLSGSPSGIGLEGQDQFYIPPGTDSVDWMVYTYQNNVLGVPQNPDGGTRFVAGEGPGSPTFARAQRDVWIDDDLGTLTAMYDFLAQYDGPAPGANNLGSFSLRTSDAANDYIHLFSWVDPANPTAFNAYYLAYNAGGTQFSQPGESPGGAWTNLALNRWYRAWTVMNLETNQILEVGIRDLETGIESVVEPAGWYLEGGAAGSSGVPINFRFFAGGGVPGNRVAFDNMNLYFDEEPPNAVETTTWGRIKQQYNR